MSQEQPKPPESVNQTPKAPKPSTNKSGRSFQVPQTGNRTQPVLKVQSIKALRSTIQLLEGIVAKLETEPTPQPSSLSADLPPRVSAPPAQITASTPVDTATAAPEAEPVPVDKVSHTPPLKESSASTPLDAPQAVPEQQTPVNAPVAQNPTTESEVPETPTFVDRFLPSFERVQAWRNAALKNIRALLPESLNQKLSDWALTGAIAGIVVILLWTTAALLPQKPVEVANVPPAEIKTPPELKAPQKPEPVKIAPPPALVLTPEQNLIAAIQNQVAEITEKYAGGLIQSIEANFQGSLLIVKVSDDWYNLKQPQQDKLADEMLRRSQELDFSKLEITDPEGTLLARAPVVGPHMVILKRKVLTTNG